jgi:hypothetical protein
MHHSAAAAAAAAAPARPAQPRHPAAGAEEDSDAEEAEQQEQEAAAAAAQEPGHAPPLSAAQEAIIRLRATIATLQLGIEFARTLVAAMPQVRPGCGRGGADGARRAAAHPLP